MSIVPLEDIHSERLEDYFRAQNVSLEIIHWKYFDRSFNASGRRGYVWENNNRVVGLIGLIPFILQHDGQRIDSTWGCDWFVTDYQKNPLIGVSLLRRAINSTDCFLAVGGTPHSRKPIRQTAQHVADDGAITLELPLRLGALTKRLEARIPIMQRLSRGAIDDFPIRWVRRPGATSGVQWQKGVADALGPLLESRSPAGWSPSYDLEYVDWQIGRCPALESWTCFFQDGRGPLAAVLLWRLKGSRRSWRLAFWVVPGSEEVLEHVLDNAISRVYGEGAVSVFAMVSSSDHDYLKLMKSRGFIERGRDPVFVCSPRGKPVEFADVTDLNYLATDLAYRL